jgi:hypothetical protein
MRFRTGVLVVTFAWLFLIPFSALLPVFARDILAVSTKGSGTAPYFNGLGALLSSRARRLVGRSDAERHCYDGRGGNLRHARRYLRGVILVCAVARGNGFVWTMPCYFSCACVDGHSSLFACQISRRDDGDISHDSGRADCRRDAHRSAVNLIGALWAGYFEEYPGDSNDGRNLFLNAHAREIL